MTQSFVGTLMYSAPELVRNERYTEKSDIWSLGCVLYELITMRQAFSAENPLILAKKIDQGIYSKEFPAIYSESLISLCKKMMNPTLAERPDILEILRESSCEILNQYETVKNAHLTRSHFFEDSRLLDTFQKNTRDNFGDNLVKIRPDLLVKMNEEPVDKLLQVIQDLLIFHDSISSAVVPEKYLVERFLAYTLLSTERSLLEIRHDLFKVISHL